MSKPSINVLDKVQTSTNHDELRAQRIWLILDVMTVTWAFFAFYLIWRGYYFAAKVCTAECVFYGVLVLVFRRTQRYRLAMEVFLVGCGIGVVALSASHPGLSRALYFFPISIMVASQLFGVRQALYWLIATLGVFTSFFLVQYGLHETLNTWRLDEMILSLGSAVCLYFCVQQAETHYQSKTKSLVNLSEDLQEQADELKILASTDSLTGLSNRFRFQQDLSRHVKQASESKQLALLLVDMDGFKEINDTLGHPVGDAALVQIAERLRYNFADRASVSRLGGDEFCILCAAIGTQQDAADLATEVHQVLTEQYVLPEAEFWLGTSVGFALSPTHADNDQDLLAYADTAMFHAKEKGLTNACYEAAMTEKLVKTRELKAKLTPALAKNEFFLVYQPQVDVHSGTIVGVEALVRWRHDGQVISPFHFVPLLEESGLIVEVSKWIIREACCQQALWSRNGLDIKMSINLSALQFRDEGFFDSISDPMHEYGIKGSQLDFEITEGLLIEDVQQTVDALNRIKQLGVSISVDDFGTGYSSLAYLRDLPIDRLKIDRAFIKDIPDADDGAIAASIIALADLIGLQVLAEGVETKEQLEFLRSHGCGEYQGYYLSPPVPPKEIPPLCSSNCDTEVETMIAAAR